MQIPWGRLALLRTSAFQTAGAGAVSNTERPSHHLLNFADCLEHCIETGIWQQFGFVRQIARKIRVRTDVKVEAIFRRVAIVGPRTVLYCTKMPAKNVSQFMRDSARAAIARNERCGVGNRKRDV